MKKDLELLQAKIDDGVLASKLQESPEWVLLSKIAKQIAEVSLQKLSKLGLEVANKGKITDEDRALIAKHQAKVEIYGGFAQNIVKNIYEEGKNAFEIAQELRTANSPVAD